MSYEFAPVECTEEKIKDYSRLLSLVFPGTQKYTTAFVDWQYAQNPVGKALGFDAFSGGKMVAHYVALPVEYLYKGKVMKGILPLNVATDPAHQGKGLFTKLAAMTFDHAKEAGYHFVIGVANQNTTNGYATRLGFDMLGPLDVKIFVGRLKPRIANRDFFQCHYSPEVMSWRLKNPENPYHQSNGCVTTRTHIGPIDALMSERPEMSAVQLPKKSSLVKMTIGYNIINGKGSLGMRLPDRFKPSPLNMIFKNLSGAITGVNRENFYFELIDFDAY
jgi:predicted N-acetyltransferase YhbS